MAESFDYIVVGAGSAGCALAARLSARATVLLLEAGGPDTSPAIHAPDGIIPLLFGEPEICVPYVTTPQGGLEVPDGSGPGRPMVVHRGVVRGGCSSVNGMLYVRGNRADFDHWAALGNEGWAYDDVLPCFKRSEDSHRGPSEHHATGGPQRVGSLPAASNASHAFVETAAGGRFPASRSDGDFNGAVQTDMAAHYDVTLTAGGTRASAAVAFLDPLVGRDALTVRTGARVTRVVMEGSRATGVDVLTADGGEARYQADGEVILCAGTFESPKILMLSGLGPADHLGSLDMPIVHELPGVGANLQDHLMVVTYGLARPETDPGMSGFLGEAGLFTHVVADRAGAPDLQLHFLAGMPGFPVDPTTNPNFLICPTLLQPSSRGRVTLASADPGVPPRVDPAYLAEAADVEVLVRGIELARDLHTAAPLADMAMGGLFALVPDPSDPFGKPPFRFDVPASGRDGLETLVRATATTVWHPVGTCSMGTHSAAVVDAQLRVHGVEGLRVADASVMPRITSGNTHAPSIMIGEKAADLIMDPAG